MPLLRPNWISAAFAALCLAAAGARGETVQQRTLHYRTTVRAAAFAEESHAIVCSVRWLQLMYVIPDGTYVQEGDLLALFDEDEAERRHQERLLDRAVIEAQLQRELTDIDNGVMDLRDSLEQLEDQLAVQEARLARYKALPDEDEVRIAAGRLRVAAMEYAAAAEDLAKAEDRLKRGMLSDAEMDAFREAAARAKAAREHARDHHEYAQLPGASSTIRKTELQIANTRMELEKIRHELTENESISAIKREGAQARLEITESRIRESAEDRERVRVTAPISGYVMYTRDFRNNVLRSGGKMWRNFTFLRMPDPRTLAFKGVIQESERGYFEKGDRVDIRVAERPEVVLQGTLHSIGALSRDRNEREEEDWGGSGESGIKVYDVVFHLDAIPDWLRYGMHAECVLTSSRAIEAPSVPLSYVKPRDDDYVLAVDGVYREVAGRRVNEYFVLENDALLGRDIALIGREPPATGDTNAVPSGYRATGELVPTDTAEVIVRDVYRWPKVAWLIAEDTSVTQGTVVATLDGNETAEEIRERRSRLKEQESQRRAQEEELKLTRREGSFQVARERNLADIARIDWQITEGGRDWPAIFDARKNVREAEIAATALDKQVARLEDGGLSYLSPLERERLKRDHTRAHLRLEAARIRLAKLESGATEVERREGERDYLDKKLDVETLERKVDLDTFRAERSLAQAREREARMQRRLDRLLTQRENLTLRAPRDGIARYARIWNSGVFSKVNVGSAVGERFILMQIADVSRMHVRVEVPEAYFSRVKEGLAVDVLVPSLTDVVLPGRVTEVEYLFENKRKKDTQTGLYSSHESLGETVFYARVAIGTEHGLALKPGSIAEVVFPFDDGGAW